MKTLSTNPIVSLTGDEFLPVVGMTFAEQVLLFFQQQGGVAASPWGDVLLDMKGIQSDKSHGIGRIKAASFAAIKDVIEKGEIILPLDYYATNGKKQMTGTEKIPEIAASSLVRNGISVSPQSRGSIAKILINFLYRK